MQQQMRIKKIHIKKSFTSGLKFTKLRPPNTKLEIKKIMYYVLDYSVNVLYNHVQG